MHRKQCDTPCTTVDVHSRHFLDLSLVKACRSVFTFKLPPPPPTNIRPCVGSNRLLVSAIEFCVAPVDLPAQTRPAVRAHAVLIRAVSGFDALQRARAIQVRRTDAWIRDEGRGVDAILALAQHVVVGLGVTVAALDAFVHWTKFVRVTPTSSRTADDIVHARAPARVHKTRQVLELAHDFSRATATRAVLAHPAYQCALAAADRTGRAHIHANSALVAVITSGRSGPARWSRVTPSLRWRALGRRRSRHGRCTCSFRSHRRCRRRARA